MAQALTCRALHQLLFAFPKLMASLSPKYPLTAKLYEKSRHLRESLLTSRATAGNRTRTASSDTTPSWICRRREAVAETHSGRQESKRNVSLHTVASLEGRTVSSLDDFEVTPLRLIKTLVLAHLP